MKYCLIVALFLSSVHLTAQRAEEDEIQLPAAVKRFVPEGWKAIAIAEGDLNKDGIGDAALVVEEINSNNFVVNSEGYGPEVLNINLRKLLVLFRDKSDDKYVIAAENSGLIPPPNSIDSPCLEDPLIEGGIKVDNGLLTVQLGTFASCGTWTTGVDTYKFRYRRGRFYLIGFDSHSFHRASGETVETGINFLTKKKSITTSFDRFDEEEPAPAPKTVWSAVKIEKLLTLEDLQWDTEMNF